MLIDPNGWLEAVAQGLPAVSRIPSVRTAQMLPPKPLGIVWHWTGGRGGFPGFGPALAADIQNYDRTKDRPASWHVLVCKDGRLIQSVPFTKGSWHVGKPGMISGVRFANINHCTVGVELENAGRLEKKNDGRFYCWPFVLPSGAPNPKLEIDVARVCQHGDYYDDFPVEQEMAATRLLQALVLWAGWKRDVCKYGHRDFDSQRKEDPGPRWNDVVLPRVLNRVFGSGA